MSSGPGRRCGQPDLVSSTQQGQHGHVVQRVVGPVGIDVPIPTEEKVAGAIHRRLALALVLLVLVQAMLVVQGPVAGSVRTLHGFIGIGSVVLALALVVAAVRSVSGLGGTTVAVALVVVTFWQTGLGHSALVALDAAPWHTPLSLAAFPLAAFHAALLSVPADGPVPDGPAEDVEPSTDGAG